MLVCLFNALLSWIEMLSVIESDAVLDAAREMNRRDILRVELESGIHEEADAETAPLEVDDDEIWARTEGVDGLRGINGGRLKVGGSHYSYGPYPRNRRILADVALATGWSIEKVREFERRCVRRLEDYFKSSSGSGQDDLSNPQPMQPGKSFTFQHISWSFLQRYMMSEMEEMDPTKMAAVRAAVIELYESNSKTGRKVLPTYDRGTKRISDDLPVSEADITRAQEALDTEARYHAAIDMRLYDKTYMPPEQVKRRITAFIVTHNMSEEDFCKAIEVTEDQFKSFINERKRRPQEESKVFHNALSFINKGKVDAQPPEKRRRHGI